MKKDTSVGIMVSKKTFRSNVLDFFNTNLTQNKDKNNVTNTGSNKAGRVPKTNNKPKYIIAKCFTLKVLFFKEIVTTKQPNVANVQPTAEGVSFIL